MELLVKHVLKPKHEVLIVEEKAKLLKEYNVVDSQINSDLALTSSGYNIAFTWSAMRVYMHYEGCCPAQAVARRGEEITCCSPSAAGLAKATAPATAAPAPFEIIRILIKEWNKIEGHAQQCKRLVLQYIPLILVNGEKFLEKNDVCALVLACPTNHKKTFSSVLKVALLPSRVRVEALSGAGTWWTMDAGPRPGKKSEGLARRRRPRPRHVKPSGWPRLCSLLREG